MYILFNFKYLFNYKIYYNMFKCQKFGKIIINKYLIKMEDQINLSKNLSSTSLHSYYNTQYLYLYDFVKPHSLLKKIEIDEKEKEIFSIIKNILKKYNKTTTCRVAGGWVRDKLLGRQNDDIDIALDDISGETIAKLINDELYPGQEKYGVVSQNCEKSKHLETATMKICGVFIDFVNLRSEKYTDTSRVPIIEIGTPEEDARRRDITINTLFYNINKEEVEDFLQTGISDLERGYVRTPIDPEITFKDDPLRIMRVIRFAVRFQFELDPKIIEAIKNEEIILALYKKISNERIAKELSLMLEGNKPQCSIYLLYKLNLLETIMKLPLLSKEIEENKTKNLNEVINLVLVGSYIMENYKLENKYFFNKYLLTADSNHKELTKLFYLALITLPFRNYQIKAGKEILRASALIIRDSLKLTNDNVKEINILNDNIEEFSKFINQSRNTFDRVSSGKFVRKIKTCYLHKLSILTVCYDYVKKCKEEGVYDVLDETLITEIIEKYQSWYIYLAREDLLNVDMLEPIIKGNQLNELFGVTGKDIGLLIELLVEYQICKPKLSYEEALEFLKNKKQELKLSDLGKSDKKKLKNKNNLI
jgi:tRNA nucleotidyltransferase (CCA-adding enzyme)